jgi:CTP:molybdopterin cytidylyltransferase MocA
MTGNAAGILLAAGDGSRLGRPKALIVIGGQSLARRGIALLQHGGADPVIVVTGAAGPDALGPDALGRDAVGRDALGPDALCPDAPPSNGPGSGTGADGRGQSGLICVHNPHWSTGMGSSLAVGLAAVPDGCTAAVLALADQPLVGPAAVRRLITAHAAGASVAVACYDGRPRNPVLIAREHWAEVAELATGDVGARPFLRAHPELVVQIECGDTGRPDDIDTLDDLARIEALLAADGCVP